VSVKSAVHFRVSGPDPTITCTSGFRHGTSPRVRTGRRLSDQLLQHAGYISACAEWTN